MFLRALAVTDDEMRRGYRNGVKTRTLTGPTEPVALTLPRARVTAPDGGQEWIRAIRKGDAYVNVHTTTFPGGEIPGEIQ